MDNQNTEKITEGNSDSILGLNLKDKMIMQFFDPNSGSNLEPDDFLIHQKKQNTPKKEIFTPTWCTNTEFENKNVVSWNKKYNQMKEQHFRLEVIERRISKDKADQYNHPVLSPAIEKRTDNLNLTQREKSYYSTYNLENEKNVKPAFWTSRIYDDMCVILNNDETDILIKQMKKYDEVVSIDEFDEMRDKRRKHHHKQDMRHVVTFSALDYATEDDDDQTQWEDSLL